MKKFRRPFIILCIIIVITALFLIPRKIIISKIECESQRGVCSDRVQILLGSHIGQSLHDAKKSIGNDLQLSTKDDTIVLYRYPSTLAVHIYETEPEFVLKKENGGFRLIDQDGYVVSEEENNELPSITLSTDLPNVGEKLDEKHLFALSLMQDLSKNYQLKDGTLTEDGLLVELPTSTKILFPLSGDREILLGSFVLVINQLNSVKEGTTMEKVSLVGKTIDLRFKNPVIR